MMRPTPEEFVEWWANYHADKARRAGDFNEVWYQRGKAAAAREIRDMYEEDNQETE